MGAAWLQKNENATAEEKTAYQSIFQSFYQLNREKRTAGKPELSVGTVHAYVLSPDGKPMDSLHVADAMPNKVAAMLERAIAALKTPRGEILLKPVSQSAAPTCDKEALVLHLTTRYLVPRGQAEARKNVDDDFVPIQAVLGKERSGQWSALPSEDWIVLSKKEWAKLLPTGSTETGRSWDIDREVATTLLTRFYPTTENNDLTTNRIDRLSLKGTIVSVKDGIARARLEGSLKMKHTFYPGRDDDNFVEATVLGYVDFKTAGPVILKLRLVTDRASYGGETKHFGAALRLSGGE